MRRRPVLPPPSPTERAFVLLCALVGLALTVLFFWAIATGRAPWWLVLLA